MVRICGHRDDARAGAALPGRSDDFRSHAHVRARLGAICRDGHLLLGRRDPVAGSCVRLWRNEQAFEDTPALLKKVNAAMVRPAANDSVRPGSAAPRGDDDSRILPVRVRQLLSFSKESGRPSVTQLMEVNREGSGLDQEHMAGRFTLTRYILYLLPVIGFIGTVEGISKALDEYQPGAADGEEPRRFSHQPHKCYVGASDRVRQHLARIILECGPDARSDAGFPAVGRPARSGRSMGRRPSPAARGNRQSAGRAIDRGRSVRSSSEMGNKLATVLEPAVRSLQEQSDRLGESLRAPIGQFAREMERLPQALSRVQTRRRHDRTRR